MDRFKNKIILITGGTSGIGIATAQRICAEGGQVICTGTREAHLDAARKALPDNSLIIRNNILDANAATELADTVRKQFGRLDGLFLNAGYGGGSRIEATTADMFDAMMGVNVKGPILQLAALESLLEPEASVVLTASIAATEAHAKGSLYAATKAAVTALGRCWAAELAPRKIRVNSIAPGPIDTYFFSAITGGEPVPDAVRERMSQMPALKRIGDAEEVAAVACFLLSDEASFVTGSQYAVDGGITFR